MFDRSAICLEYSAEAWLGAAEELSSSGLEHEFQSKSYHVFEHLQTLIDAASFS
jgi:hypothetical protein